MNQLLDFYSLEEKEIIDNLNNLLSYWMNKVEKNNFFIETKLSPDTFINDGIFPYYLYQNPKILIIGKESYGLEGFNYIDLHFEWIKNKNFNGKPLGRITQWRRSLRFIYGIIKNIQYSEIPSVYDIAETFGTKNGISFGFINVSKISRPYNGTTIADVEKINLFLNAGKDNDFHLKQIKIINPDIIITQNIISMFGDKVFSDKLKFIHNIDGVNIYSLMFTDKIIPVLDTYHFSYPRLNEAEYFNNIIKSINYIKNKFKYS